MWFVHIFLHEIFLGNLDSCFFVPCLLTNLPSDHSSPLKIMKCKSHEQSDNNLFLWQCSTSDASCLLLHSHQITSKNNSINVEEAMSIKRRCWYQLNVFLFCSRSTLDISLWDFPQMKSNTTSSLYMCCPSMADKLPFCAFDESEFVSITTEICQTVCIL